MNIVDKSGTWFTNSAAFVLVDPTNGTRFEPGESVKATRTAWVASQPTITRCGDPSSDLTEKEQLKLDAENAADAAARDGALVAAELAQARARGDTVTAEALAPAEKPAAK